MKHGNIALFVPHNGCPNQCTFCNQKSITGVQYQPSESDVDSAVSEALKSAGKYDFEIAFFGGSFTAIDRKYMVSLLKAAYKYVENKSVRGIRISTRPDAIDKDVLDILKSYGVTSIELGAQSMCDEVLSANRRGHSSDDVRRASALIKEYGFSLGLQMMTGLYKSSFDRDVETAREIIKINPDTVRIYPTVTIDGTVLAELYKSGEYKPSNLEESVNLCALLLKMFSDNNIEVIRLGLHYSEELERDMLFNNYHPAFREVCESRLMLDEVKRIVADNRFSGVKNLLISVNPKSVSKLVGQKRANILELNRFGYSIKLNPDSKLSAYQIIVEPQG